MGMQDRVALSCLVEKELHERIKRLATTLNRSPHSVCKDAINESFTVKAYDPNPATGPRSERIRISVKKSEFSRWKSQSGEIHRKDDFLYEALVSGVTNLEGRFGGGEG